MHYFDALKHGSYEDINNLIDSCEEFHNATSSTNFIDKNIILMAYFSHFLALTFIKKNLALVAPQFTRRNLTELSHNPDFPGCLLKLSRKSLIILPNVVVPLRL